MPEVVKYGRCEPWNKETALEAFINGDIGFMQHYFPILFENIPEETLRWEKLFCCGKHSSYCRRGIG